jgi:hypothetical protein
VPLPVLGEIGYLLESRVGPQAEVTFLKSFGSDGFQIAELEEQDIRRMAELVETYIDLPLGMVDAAVIAIAERLRLTEIATLDHRHFAVVQQKHTPAFILLPSQMSSDRKVGTIKRTSSTHRQGSSALVQYPPPRDFGLRGARSQSHWLPVWLPPGFR